MHETGIFWFGRVTPTENYADVRVGYNNTSLTLHANIFDKRIWHDTNTANTSFAQLTAWDTIVFYLDTGATAGNVPATTTYRIAAQHNWAGALSTFQSSARGNGTGWADLGNSLPITIESAWRGSGPNGNSDNRGWFMHLVIPWRSLGQSGPPTIGTTWRLGVRLFDRDDAAGSAIPVKFWPEAMQPEAPITWGQLGFGFPTPNHPNIAPKQTITIQHKLNGVTVADSMVGGGSVCADPYANDYFSGFGTANYANSEFFNIQNQADVADWPCFSKFYITFPLTALPANSTIISATLTTTQFGNSGQGVPPTPYSSLIQIFTLAENWQEATINWNNAPLALENVSIARSLVMTRTDPVPSVPVVWDVTQAVDAAYRAGKPLNIALYDADTAQNSGKYFWTSDIPDGRAYERPTLLVVLGTGSPTSTATPGPSPTPIPSPTRNPALTEFVFMPVVLRD
jgi:hypothetical protein